MPKDTKDFQTWVKGQPSPYQLRDITHFPDWGNLTIWDAFFNNLTSGLMIVTTISFFCGSGMLSALLPIALTIALVLVLVDLVILVFDLADPWRFYHCLRVLRFTSPLSVGVWALVTYSIFLTLAAFFSWVVFYVGGEMFAGIILVSLRNLFLAMALIAAVVIICYKGVVFSCSSQPGLANARWLTPFMVSDSLLIGYALFTLIALVFIMPQDAPLLVAPMLTLICARCICFGLLWMDVKRRARLVYHSENRVLGWCVYIFCGLFPFLLCFLGYFGLALACFLVLFCGVLERYWLLGLPRPLPDGKTILS